LKSTFAHADDCLPSISDCDIVERPYGGGMSKLVIFATLEVQPGTRDRAVKILVDHCERCLRDEPGTLQFEVLVPTTGRPVGT
jgi:hypothetical protein